VNDPEPITVSVTRTVKRGYETEFERVLHEFVQRSLTLPGQLGVYIMRPAPGSCSREYGIVRKFSNRDALSEFRTSREYLEWNQLAVDLTEGSGRTVELTGLESWFTPPGAPLRSLPKWKMAIATFVGVFPVAMVLTLTLGPVIKSWPFILSSVLFDACMVSLLTWAVMPLVTRALHGWLHPQERKI